MSESRKSVAIFGSTGSVGTQTLDVIRQNSEKFEVIALIAGTNLDLIQKQVEEFKPKYVSLANDSLEDLKHSDIEVVPSGEISELAKLADISVNAIVGFAGLDVTVACLNAGKRLALANKESLIAAGPLVRKARTTPNAEIIPVDSEHAAIHQCLLEPNAYESLSKIHLTASGGPFRSRYDLEEVTLDEALNHPTWSMGPKITIDSSTLMNKGLEVIEAYELFCAPNNSNLTLEDIEVVVHPQSIVHSMVTFSDGSTIAQLSNPDMRLPISYALGFPNRLDTPFGKMDWTKPHTLEFEKPDISRFPSLQLAYDSIKIGDTGPTWLNAANEVAVDAFLNDKIKWIDISVLVEKVLSKYIKGNADTVLDVIYADKEARRVAENFLR